jgi:hypothetical protein
MKSFHKGAGALLAATCDYKSANGHLLGTGL